MKTCPLCDTDYPNHQSNCDKDGALLIESLDLEPGTTNRNKYRIVHLLGHGGMETVYLAEHILLGQQRALKFISSELSQNAHFLKRFRHEAQAAIQLRHPNVVEVVYLGHAEDGSPSSRWNMWRARTCATRSPPELSPWSAPKPSPTAALKVTARPTPRASSTAT
jgi:serine/threonine protein kinase